VFAANGWSPALADGGILARDPDSLPGKTTNHRYFCWRVLTKGLFDETRVNPGDRVGCGASPWDAIKEGRVTLPLI
jgi:hypothetical protein